MDRHKIVKRVDGKELDEYKRDNVKICAMYAENCREELDRLDKFQQIRKGRFGCIDKSRHFIKRTAPDVLPINFAPYRAGLKAPEFESAEVDKVLSMSGVAPTPAEWA